ncbi:phosphotransferase [Paenibacillus sepulcri]|uniref:Phosphotransferase n=1 Tax=Paenibacillus sepulcri TaxID=359917 RepID=A0ABS7C676_9BACL|nr:phosphotransferase [Paenibacillus sepulcri]
MKDISGIISDLIKKGVIDNSLYAANSVAGTTDGLVYMLTANKITKYVLKLDLPQQIIPVEQLFQTYRSSPLLPKLLYTDPAKDYIVYTYIEGTTHYERGAKLNWLTILINGLLNHYENNLQTKEWGFWLEDPCQTWRDFIDKGVEYARTAVGNLLPVEDYDQVKALVGNIAEGEDGHRFLLHGDCGVHNFVFHRNALAGVIDPSPIAGPVIYDFIYAFCSSPDDLNLETLLPAFELLNHRQIERSGLIEEVIIQLYCRIGVCLKHHPHDLKEYLKAWDYWKALAPEN